MGLLNPKAAPKGLLASAQKLQKMGNGGDSILAHIGPKEALMLKQAGGAGTINKRTGLLQFEEGAGDAGSGDSGSGSGVGTGGPGDNADAAGSASGHGLTGQESATAVESGEIPGTPVGTPDPNSVGTAAAMGLLGKFGQPDLGLLDGPINGIMGTINGVMQGNPQAIGQVATNALIGVIPGLGLANTISGALGGPTVGSVAMGMMGQGQNSNTGVSAGNQNGPATDGNSGSGGDASLGQINTPPQRPSPSFNPVNPFTLPPLQFPGQVPPSTMNPTNPLFRFGNRGLLGR